MNRKPLFSAERQLTFISWLHELVENHSQFIIATHSPIILSYPNATIYEIGEDGLSIVTYGNTEQYKFMKLFINHYPSILRKIMDWEINIISGGSAGFCDTVVPLISIISCIAYKFAPVSWKFWYKTASGSISYNSHN